MKKQLLITIAAFLSLTAFSQKKDISAGTGILLNGNTGKVMYRKYSKNMDSAKRYEITNFSISNNYKNILIDDDISNKDIIDEKLKKQTSSRVTLGFIFGKQKNISKIEDIQFYSGNSFGINMSFVNTNSPYLSYTTSSYKVYKAVSGSLSNFKSYDLNIFPGKFVGIQYKIVKNLYVSAEIILNLNFNISMHQSSEKFYNIIERTIEDKDKSTKENPQLNSNLNLSFGASSFLSYRF